MDQNSVLQKAMHIGIPRISNIDWSSSMEITEQGTDHRMTELSTWYVHEKGIGSYRLYGKLFPGENRMYFSNTRSC